MFARLNEARKGIMLQNLDFDWFILLLRVLFIFLLYFFLYQIVRVTSRELTAIASATTDGRPESPPPSGRLVVVDGAESDLPPGASFALEPTTTIGRHDDAVVRLEEPFVSARHAEITFNLGRWWIRDLHSTNGTYINGQPISAPTGLRAGDVVQFGRIKLQFVR